MSLYLGEQSQNQAQPRDKRVEKVHYLHQIKQCPPWTKEVWDFIWGAYT
jgi:hypothetical protein